MSEKLQKEIQTFCMLLPESKIGEYSANTHDDKRLVNIYKTAIENGEDVRPLDILNCLRKCYPNYDDKVLSLCADTAFRHMCDISNNEE